MDSVFSAFNGRLLLILALLIVTVSFLNVPILALLAIPFFAMAVIYFGYWYLRLPVSDGNTAHWGANTLFLIGFALFVGVLFNVAEFDSYLLAYSSRYYERIYPDPWMTFFKFMLLNAFAAGAMALAVTQRLALRSVFAFTVWLELFLSAPISMLVMKMLSVLDIPFGT